MANNTAGAPGGGAGFWVAGVNRQKDIFSAVSTSQQNPNVLLSLL